MKYFTLILMNIIISMIIILLDVNLNCVLLIRKAMELLGVIRRIIKRWFLGKFL